MNFRTASLFSGIGGMSLGKPELYCEINARARAVLEARMADGSIPSAAIVDDITTLESLPANIDMIEAGFPCQGVSSCGFKKGLNDERSGLFWHVARLTATSRPQWVFLENVEAIRTKPAVWRSVLEAMAALGYDSHWLMLGANQVGAPHRRNRWFCLCKKVRQQDAAPAKNTLPKTTNISGCSSLMNGIYREEAPLQLPIAELNPKLVMRHFPGVACRCTVVTKDVSRRSFATPRCKGGTFATVNLTRRSCNDLASQLKFAIDTPKEQRNCTQVAADWVEWLMGFPCGWTLHAPLQDHTTTTGHMSQKVSRVSSVQTRSTLTAFICWAMRAFQRRQKKRSRSYKNDSKQMPCEQNFWQVNTPCPILRLQDITAEL